MKKRGKNGGGWGGRKKAGLEIVGVKKGWKGSKGKRK